MTIGPISGTTPPLPQLAPYTKFDTKEWRARFTDAFDAIAAKLGMSKSDLISALQSGQKMKDIEAAKGVSKDDVINAAAGALQQDDPSLSSVQAQQLATLFYDGKIGHRHHHHHHLEPEKPWGTPPVDNSRNDWTQQRPATRVDVRS